MHVLKRNGKLENVSFDKITNRISKLSEDLLENVSPELVAKKVIEGIFDGVSTEQLDRLAAEIAGSLALSHPDYSKLASRLVVSNLHKATSNSFYLSMKKLYDNVDPKTSEHAPLVSKDFLEIIKENRKEIEEEIDCEKDFIYSYFGINTLMKSYLIKSGGKIVERPQYLLMRVAIGIWQNNLKEAFKLYQDMSKKAYTHATPTLFNAGTNRAQLSSCFLLMNAADSLDGIMKTKWDVAKISSLAGGIGLAIHNVRASGSYIKGSGGTSKGLLPLFKTYNEEARYWDQCFSGETLVRKPTGSVQISTVIPGDILISTNNKANKVREVKKFTKENISLYRITCGNTFVEVTAEHPIMIIKNANAYSDEDILTGLKNNILIPEWVEAFEVTQKDIVISLNVTEEKVCPSCGIKKNVEEYYNNFQSKLSAYCKDCSRISKRDWKKTLGGKKAKKRYEESVLGKASKRKYRSSAKGVIMRNKSYSKAMEDPNKKIEHRMRSLLISAFNRKKLTKNLSLEKAVGCTVEYLKKHLENLFIEEMSWDNYGLYGWHVDHVKPCALFDFSKEEDVLECFNYKNLQPLWAEDNLKKGTKYEA